MEYNLTEFEKEMEAKLIEMRDSINSKLAQTDADFRSVIGSMGIKDSVDLATDDMATRKMEAVSQIDASRLKAIDQALTRLKNGKYGICAMCGKKIPEERLRALPYALMCMDCKKESERH